MTQDQASLIGEYIDSLPESSQAKIAVIGT
jgi:hypothetical protein